jgi:glutaredoxin
MTLKLIHSKGCGHTEQALEALETSGKEYEVICQDDLAENDDLRNYSSPSILLDGKSIVGGKITGGGG